MQLTAKAAKAKPQYINRKGAKKIKALQGSQGIQKGSNAG